MSTEFSARLSALRSHLQGLAGLDHAYPFRSARSGTAASVMVLVSIGEIENESIDLLITRRTETVEKHKGQYALPGGMRDPADQDLRMTALRETEEEVGIRRDRIEVLGELPAIWTPTGFLVTPIVGLLREPRGQVVIEPSEAEINLWFWCPLSRLTAPETYHQEERELIIDGKTIRAPMDVYQVDTHRIWGVTGAILRNFIERWKLSESGSSATLRNI